MLRNRAAQARGKFVTVKGALLITQRWDKPPNIAGVDHVYWCVMRTRDGDPIWVFTLDEPKGLKRKDYVQAHGVFMKMLKYTSVQGYEYPAVVVVARKLELIEYEDSPHLTILMLVIGGITAAGLTFAVLLERRKRRRAGDHVRQLAARVRPTSIDAAARAIASRTRQARDKLTESGHREEQPGDEADEDPGAG